MRVRRIVTDSTTPLTKLSALDSHVRGSLLRDIEKAGLPVQKVDARIDDVPRAGTSWSASAWLRDGTALAITCVARRRFPLGRVAVISWRAELSLPTRTETEA